MWYFGLGYAGLYFPPIPATLPPSEFADLEVEIPMRVVTRSSTPAVAVLQRATLAMEIAPMVLIPMTRGVPTRVDVPMHVPTRVWLEKN